MSSAVKTQGTVVKRGNGATPESFTAIAEVAGVTGIGSGEAKEIDTTHLGSTAEEYLIGLPNEGTITLEGNYVSSDSMQDALYDDRNNQVQRNFQIILPGSVKTFSFAAFVKSVSLDAKANDKWTIKISLRVTGSVTRT